MWPTTEYNPVSMMDQLAKLYAACIYRNQLSSQQCTTGERIHRLAIDQAKDGNPFSCSGVCFWQGIIIQIPAYFVFYVPGKSLQ